MSEPNSAANPTPEKNNPQPASSTPSAADLAKAVLGAAETVARASAGDVPGAVKSGLETATTAATSNQPQQPSVVPAPHVPLPAAQPTAESVAQIAEAVSTSAPGRVDQSGALSEPPGGETDHTDSAPENDEKKEKKK